MKYKLGLLGKNIENSKSPKIHKFIMSSLNFSGTYDLLTFNNDLDEKYLGYNVTTPYKLDIIEYLDDLTSVAKEIGAVNTIYKKGNKWIGTNTDYDGFLFLLKNNNINVKNKNVYILGSSGAALAVYKVVKDLKGYPVIVARDYYKHLKDKKTILYEDLNEEDVDIYVHATNIKLGEMVLPKNKVKNHFVVELQVHNEETEIQKYAKQSINGLDMLIYQALKSAEIWFETEIINDDIIKSLKEVVIK